MNVQRQFFWWPLLFALLLLLVLLIQLIWSIVNRPSAPPVQTPVVTSTVAISTTTVPTATIADLSVEQAEATPLPTSSPSSVPTEMPKLTPTNTPMPPTATSTSTESPRPPTATETATSTSTATRRPTPRPTDTPTLLPTLSLIQVSEPPPRDLVSFSHSREYAPRPQRVGVELAIDQNLNQQGTKRTFWLRSGDAQETPYEITATLALTTPHLDFWLEEGMAVSPYLQRNADYFERHIYPLGEQFFGKEIASQSVTLLHASMPETPSVAYYAALDEYPASIYPWSNGTSIIYINTHALNPASDYYTYVLAHEWQHVLHWRQDPNEPIWFNEGLSELLATMATKMPSRMTDVYWQFTDIPLLAWPRNNRATALIDDSPIAAFYGGNHLFLTYLLAQIGETSIAPILSSADNGQKAFEPFLSKQGLTFDLLFAQWLVENGLSGQPTRESLHLTFPVQRQAAVHPYGADYIEIQSDQRRTLTIEMPPTHSVVPMQLANGGRVWWSGQADESMTTLTRAFDLRTIEAANLHFDLWHDIDESGDCAYLEVSTDGGERWQILAGRWSRALVNETVAGCHFGPHYTGISGEDNAPQWVEEQVALTPFAGQQIWLRFTYLTDQVDHGVGFAIDNLSIAKIGYMDDVEAADGWQAQGFIHLDKQLDQQPLVQVILFGEKGDLVYPVEIDRSTGRGVFQLDGLDGGIEKALLIVSATTPFLEDVIPYIYWIE